jgi:ribonuclease E
MGSKLMVMNVTEPEEVRVAVIEDGELAEIFMERRSRTQQVGNIYRGKVTNVEPSLQAAFVDIGLEKNGFLHASDVAPPDGGFVKLFAGGKMPGEEAAAEGEAAEEGEAGDDDDEEDDRFERFRAHRGRRLRVEQMLRRGQDVLVEIAKEGIGHKGPSLTTYVSLPGRFLVLMPTVNRLGVSRKITDPRTRAELRKTLMDLNPPRGLGFIIRTAGQAEGAIELKRDLDYLVNLWREILAKARSAPTASLVHQEADLELRAVRDLFTSDTDQVLVDDRKVCQRVKKYLGELIPKAGKKVVAYTEPTPLFTKYRVEEQIEKLASSRVTLAGGGYLIIEQTEALVTIDVNSGRFRVGDSNAATILQTNLDAGREIARQLRLRDMGGLIMLDFIDMESAGDRRKVQDLMARELARGRARFNIMPISPLGVMELTRQRVHHGLLRAMFQNCPICQGAGRIKTVESMGLVFIRRMRAEAEGAQGRRVEVFLGPRVALDIANRYRAEIARIEEEFDVRVTIHSQPDLPDGEVRVTRGSSVTSEPEQPHSAGRPHSGVPDVPANAPPRGPVSGGPARPASRPASRPSSRQAPRPAPRQAPHVDAPSGMFVPTIGAADGPAPAHGEPPAAASIDISARAVGDAPPAPGAAAPQAALEPDGQPRRRRRGHRGGRRHRRHRGGGQAPAGGGAPPAQPSSGPPPDATA